MTSLMVALLLLGAIPDCAYPGELITVQLQSGRRFTAIVDQRTNDRQLCLRFDGEGTTIFRCIDWDRVVSAKVGDTEIEGSLLRQRSKDLMSSSSVEVSATPFITVRVPPAIVSEPGPSLVHSVDFYARAANWDNDVNVDGIALNVFPLDGDGQIVAVSASLEVDLIGVHYKDFEAASQSQGYTLDRIGHWIYPIQPTDLTSRGITVRLPYQAVHPEWSTRYGIYGIVHVRLAIPGQGVFEASQDGVRLRPSAPVRDAYELQQNRRFFSIERH